MTCSAGSCWRSCRRRLSLETVLKRKETIYAAFPGIDTVADYGGKDICRLMADPGIIRHRQKVDAAIHNARLVQGLQKRQGSFAAWLNLQKGNRDKSKEAWARAAEGAGFKFVGPEIVNEWLMSSCYLPGAHVKGCKLYRAKLHG